MSYDAGEIQYTVSVETQESIDAAKKINDSLGKTEKQMNKTTKETKGFNASLTPLAASIKRAFSRQNTAGIESTAQRISSLRGAALRLAGALGIAFSAASFGQMIKRNIDLAASTLDVAEKLGTTTEALSKMRYAVSQTAGVTSQEFDVALQRMTRRLAEAAQGGGVAKDAIQELGLSTTDLAKSSPDEAFRLIMEQMSKLPTQADRVRLAFKFFDSGGVKLAQTAKGGAAGLEELYTQLENVGGVIKTSTAQQAAELNTKLGELGARFQGVGMQIAGEALPALEEFVDLFNDPELMANLAALGVALVEVGGVAVTVASEFGDLINQVGYFSKWLKNDVTQLETLDRKIKDVQRSLSGEGLSTTLSGMWYSKDELNEQLADLNKQRDAILKLKEAAEPGEESKNTPNIPNIPLGKAKSELDGLTESTDRQRDANADLIKSLQLMKDTLGMSQTAAALYKMETEGATDEQLTQAAVLLESIDAYKKTEDAQKQYETTVKSLNDEIKLLSVRGRELVELQIEMQLGEYATPQQIEEAKKLAGALYDITQQQEKIEEFGKNPEAVIRGDVPILSGGRFDDGTARYEAEKEQEEKRMLEQLERLKEARAAGVELEKGYDELREELYAEHMARMTEIDRVRLDAQLDMWGSGFGAMASDLQNFASVFATESTGMFNIAKAASIAEAVINTYKAATGAYSAMASIPYVGPGLGIAAASAAIAGGMANVAKIRTQQMGGARFYGGPTDADKFYKVNEGGLPEIFKGRDGHQYLMPNQGGEVVSNKNATSGGGVTITVNLHQSQERAGSVDHSGQDSADQVIDIFVADITGDGRAAAAMQSKWGLSPQGY